MLEEFPVIDGYSLRRNYRCNMTFEAMAVTQFDNLRRAGNFKQKQWAFPRDPFDQPIPAAGVSQKELRVGIGAVIWGYTISDAISSDAASGRITAIQVSDSCTDEALFSEPSRLPVATWPGSTPFGYTGPILLPRLLVIGKPGIIVIELATLDQSPARQQIVLYGAVPVGVNQ